VTRFFAWMMLMSGVLAACSRLLPEERGVALQLLSLPMLFIAVSGMGISQLTSRKSVSSSNG
jgi:hypothetical protein